jgi:glycosyltransferase involved in cell wall biosynthesis
VIVAFQYLGVNIISKQDINPPIFISSPYLLYVGRLVKRKGCGWFIENVLPNLEDDIRLVVVGKSWDVDEMKIIQNNPRVIYESYLADEHLGALRKGALAVVMPNINSRGVDFDGFGLTALEAAADGGVLLASRIDGIVDAVIDEKTGFLIQPENTFEWVNKINEVKSWSNSYRFNFIKKAKSRLKADYSWYRVALKTFDLYKTSGEKL